MTAQGLWYPVKPDSTTTQKEKHIMSNERLIAVLGDLTTGGGEIVTASSTITIDGKRVALVGDKATCKKHRGLREIVSGLTEPNITNNGRQLVGHGCRLDCGHQIIAGKQTIATHESDEAPAPPNPL
jgi:uncharacterized Zn-binding protein involved in type VI secretion